MSDLQRTLNACYQAGLSVDNSYGTLTMAALKEAQQDSNINPQDGLYGPITRDGLLWLSSDGACHKL